LYRDKQRACLLGVCAGVSDYFGFKLTATRVLIVVLTCFFMPVMLLIYIGAGFILPVKPEGLYQTEQEENFWRSVRRDPRNTLHTVRYRFRDLESRLQRMERYVTSPRFKLDREFRDLQGK